MALRLCALCLASTGALVRASEDTVTLIQAQVVPDGDTPKQEGNKAVPVAAAQGASKERAVEGGSDDSVTDLLNRPEAVFKEMNEQVSSLQSEVDGIRQRGHEALSNQQATFEAKYVEQQKANAELKASNEEVLTSVTQFQTSNRQLFSRGKDLQRENDNLRAEIEQMRHKLADADEFIHEKAKALADESSPEEAVIKEIEDFDAEVRSDEDHRQHVDAISSVGKEPLAALLEDDSDPVTILKVMEDTVTNLNEEQRSSEVKLKEIYMKKFETEATQHASLLKSQTRLTEKRESLRVMFQRLTDAVKHLDGIRDGLQQSIASLAAFTAKLGKDHVANRDAQGKQVSLSEEGLATERHGAKGDGSIWSWIKGAKTQA